MEKYRSLSDKELVNLLKIGNHDAFNEIHKRYYPLIYRHAYKRLPDREEIRDILQEIFAFLWNNRETLNFSTGLPAYLYTAARNKVLNVFSRKTVRHQYAESFQGFIDYEQNITDWTIRVRELSVLVEKEIAALPPQMRKVFELSRNEHLSHNEIAKMLNSSPLTVRKQIQNALKVLKSKLGTNVFFIFF